MTKSFHHQLLILIFSFLPLTASAQTVHEPPTTNAEWTRPYPPFRIAGNLYYVGTHDLACYLVTTGKGNILINTGLASSAAQIENNIKALGFRLTDTKLLLITQAHHDHTGAIAALKKRTGAMLWVNAADAPVMADGGSSDYAFGNGTPTFAPVKPDSLLKNGDTIRLGVEELVLLSHPGHTKGSSSYLLKTKDDKRLYTVLIANLPSIVTEKKFTEVTTYPGIAADYAATFTAMKNLQFDVWVASHASQFQLHQKHKPGDPYTPAAFSDNAGYQKAIAGLEKQYNGHLKRE